MLQTRELRIAPDGVHVGFTQVRIDGWVMSVGRLQRLEDRYVIAEARIVNPRFQLGERSEDWRHAGAFYEIKGFVGGGRTLIYSASVDGSQNLEDYALDMATGERRRLTNHIDWDEPLVTSPDGRSLVLGSARTKNRMDVWSMLPRPSLFDFVSFAHIGRWMLAPGMRDCILDPWLRATDAQENGYLGQQLNPRSATEGWGGRTIANWSPDGTAITWWEQARRGQRPAGSRRARMLVALLPARHPSPRTEAVGTPEPAWAQPYAERPARDRGAIQVVRGARAGAANVVFVGNAVSGEFSVTYDGYSDDGESVLDGSERIRNTFLASDAVYSVDLRLSGARSGHMRGEVTFSADLASGTLETVVGERHVSGVPQPEPCPTPRPPRLRLKLVRGRPAAGSVRRLVFRVTASPYGHRLPVRGASVRFAGRRARTSAGGRAVMRVRVRSARRLRASAHAAGFEPATLRLRR